MEYRETIEEVPRYELHYIYIEVTQLIIQVLKGERAMGLSTIESLVKQWSAGQGGTHRPLRWRTWVKFRPKLQAFDIDATGILHVSVLEEVGEAEREVAAADGFVEDDPAAGTEEPAAAATAPEESDEAGYRRMEAFVHKWDTADGVYKSKMVRTHGHVILLGAAASTGLTDGVTGDR